MQASIVLALLIIPVVAAMVLLLGQRRLRRKVAAYIGIAASGITLLLVLALWQFTTSGAKFSLPWFSIAEYQVSFNLELEPLNIFMLLMVSSVTLLVMIYSRGYMRTDKRLPVFYAYLSLFLFSMIGLVISANLLQIYIFWELVGLCSFLLIGFWYFKPAAKGAAKKAFIVTRIGDLALLLAILILFAHVGSFDLADLREAVTVGTLDLDVITFCSILAFVGAMAKSGQFPLHVWLPDAMEGPTPVSALIHAATMVAAGVYLVAVLFFMFQVSPAALYVVALVGGVTALFAAIVGCFQNELKRILAYSTVSQLGLMMLALGSLGYAASLFHLMTHGFVKALLFLAIGIVIYLSNGENNLYRVGGLMQKHRWLATLFLIGCLGNAGLPPFAGFFSKDEILAAAYYNHDGYFLFVLALLTSVFTSYYMFRLFFNIFLGSPHRGIEILSEVSRYMRMPVLLLAGVVCLIGWTNYPGSYFSNWLGRPGEEHPVFFIMLASVTASLLGIFFAYSVWRKRSSTSNWLYLFFYRRCYIDELYMLFVVYPLKILAVLISYFERYILEAVVGVIGGLVHVSNYMGSRLQNGQAQSYLLVTLFGMLFVALSVILFVGGYF